MGVIALPTSFKIVYGFLSDNFSVLNSKRRGHIIMNAFCCIFAMTFLIIFGTRLGKYCVTGCLFISMMNMSYNDTVTDALTVQACSKGIKNGGVNLNSISFMS